MNSDLEDKSREKGRVRIRRFKNKRRDKFARVANHNTSPVEDIRYRHRKVRDQKWQWVGAGEIKD